MKDHNAMTQQDLEQGLERIFPQPDPAFLNRLEGELVHQARLQSTAQAARPGFSGWLEGVAGVISQRRRTALALGLALLLAVIVLAAGPQHVVDAVLRIFGYAPNVGFVEAGKTRILAAPVTARQGDVTVSIDKMVATEDRTLLSLSVSGLPKEKYAKSDDAPYPYLLLPDGQRLEPQAFLVGMGDTLATEIDFPALAPEIMRVTLVMPRLPSLPAGFAPENWSIPLDLQMATETPEAAGENALVKPYAPVDASATTHGVTARVLQVANSAQETGIQVQLTWANPDWKALDGLHMGLADDMGRAYDRLINGLGEFTGSLVETAPYNRTMSLRFVPFLPGAHKATLTLDELVFTADSSAAFTFDPGKDPQPGQVWNLDGLPGMQINAAGVPVEVLNASLGAGMAQGSYHLEFLLQVKPQDSLSVQSFPRLVLEPQNLRSYMVESLPGDQLRLAFDLPELPRQPMTVRFEQVNLLLKDPLQMVWDLPAGQ